MQISIYQTESIVRIYNIKLYMHACISIPVPQFAVVDKGETCTHQLMCRSSKVQCKNEKKFNVFLRFYASQKIMRITIPCENKVTD